MRILVTGHQGQVAQSLAARANREHRLVFAGRPGLDLVDPVSIERTIEAERPDLVFSVAAYTAVDRAESEPDLAQAVNGAGPGVLARAAARIGAGVVHLSTDYVFDGNGDRAYVEEDPVAPTGVYGRTKLSGEREIAAAGARYAILRTAWVYSPFGHNFVKTMLRLAAERETLTVVDDQFGCPTSALEIADAMLLIADRWRENPRHGANAIYHFAGSGESSWADFARAVFESSARHGGPTAHVEGIPTSAYPSPARRPANSRLDSSKFAAMFGLRAKAWQESLDQVVARLVG